MALRPYSRQAQLWGPSPDAVLPADHLARVIDELIESFDVARLNRRYEHTPGEPAFDVRLLCKVLIYAYARGITSSRQMARECGENYAFAFLADGQRPDHRTWSRFRRQKRRLLRWVFAQTVRLGREMGLVRLGLVAIDSVKLQADARPSRKRTAEQLQQELGKLDVYLAEVEACDRQEDARYGEAGSEDTLSESLGSAQRRRDKLARALAKLQRDQAEQRAQDKAHVRKDVIPTDPDAVWVKKRGTIIPGYNAHAAADAQCGMVVAVKAEACAEEREALNPMIRAVAHTAGAAAETVLADNGYYTDAALVEAESGPSRALVPDGKAAARRKREEPTDPSSLYHSQHFVYDESSDTFTCPQQRKLVVRKKHLRRGLPTTVYRGVDCESCPVRAACTSDRSGHRSIEVHRPYGPIRRAHERLRREEGRALFGRRKTIIEPVFGQWQHNRGVRRLRLRGLSGCDIELHLLAIGHNAQKFAQRRVKLGRS